MIVRKDGKVNYKMSNGKYLLPNWVYSMSYIEDGYYLISDNCKYNVYSLLDDDYLFDKWYNSIIQDSGVFICLDKYYEFFRSNGKLIYSNELYGISKVDEDRYLVRQNTLCNIINIRTGQEYFKWDYLDISIIEDYYLCYKYNNGSSLYDMNFKLLYTNDESVPLVLSCTKTLCLMYYSDYNIILLNGLVYRISHNNNIRTNIYNKNKIMIFDNNVVLMYDDNVFFKFKTI